MSISSFICCLKPFSLRKIIVCCAEAEEIKLAYFMLGTFVDLSRGVFLLGLENYFLETVTAFVSSQMDFPLEKLAQAVTYCHGLALQHETSEDICSFPLVKETQIHQCDKSIVFVPG